jgi:hypothetical protein
VPLAALSVGLLVLGVVQGGPWGWTDPRVLLSFVGAALLFPIFLLRSARHPVPLLDLGLFRLRSFSVALVAQGLFVGTFMGWLVLMPSFLQGVWGWSALAAGFALAPGPAVTAVLSPVLGRLADRIGHRVLVVAGAIAGATGALWWVFAVGPNPDYPRDILPGILLTGVSGTVGFATLTGAMMRDVPARFYSMAGATRSTVFQLASAIGIAVAVALLGASRGGHVAPYARTWVVTAGGALSAAVIVALAYRAPIRRGGGEVAADVPAPGLTTLPTAPVAGGAHGGR